MAKGLFWRNRFTEWGIPLAVIWFYTYIYIYIFLSVCLVGISFFVAVCVCCIDAPRCKPGTEQSSVGSINMHSIDVRCEVDADPAENIRFSWTYNNTRNVSPVCTCCCCCFKYFTLFCLHLTSICLVWSNMIVYYSSIDFFDRFFFFSVLLLSFPLALVTQIE